MSAVYITNEIDDILVLINLLRSNDKRKQYQASELSTDGSNALTRNNLDQRKFSQYIS